MGTYLGAIDLVTQNQVTIFARVGINPADRLVGDISPGNAQITVNNKSLGIKQVGTQISAEINVTKSVVDTMGGKLFNPVETPLSFYSTPPATGYSSFNQQVGSNFGTLAVTATNFSSQLYNTPGVYSWTVPAGVTSISVAGIGGGGGGAQRSAGGAGGGGGLISYSNSISVTPGTTCTIVVGSGGATGGTYGENGSSTYMLLPGSNIPIVIAQGGAGGDRIYWTDSSQGVTYTDNTGTITTQAAYDPAGGTISYSISAGSLPTGASLNVNTGAISWVFQNLSVDTEYTPFTLAATNGPQTITKPFALKIKKRLIVNATYVVIAGGGPGGGYYYGGGGGAGGLLSNVGSTIALTPASTYTVTVGSGGAGGTGALSNGNNSSIIGTGLSVTTLGGGRGGNVYTTVYNATVGGSGGGSSSAGANSAAGTAGPPRQGYDGGAGGSYGGGGGGSGGNGTSGVGTSYPTGLGGTGTNLTSIVSVTLANSSGVGYVTGTNVLFAGGGGAGEDGNAGALTYQAPGSAGGGTGATYINGTFASDGQAYTGSGGGGACHVGTNNSNSGSGGKGVVIIRYASTIQLATGGDVIDSTGGYYTHIFKNSGNFVTIAS
jgi:hypothetical protein